MTTTSSGRNPKSHRFSYEALRLGRNALDAAVGIPIEHTIVDHKTPSKAGRFPHPQAIEMNSPFVIGYDGRRGRRFPFPGPGPLLAE
jgi:predicted subunit of tRNA(5-methylaminomethyl-2-thiouridylate) methyltransferase